MSMHAPNRHNNDLDTCLTSRLRTRTTSAHCTRPLALLPASYSSKATRDSCIPHAHVSVPTVLFTETDSLRTRSSLNSQTCSTKMGRVIYAASSRYKLRGCRKMRLYYFGLDLKRWPRSLQIVRHPVMLVTIEIFGCHYEQCCRFVST